MSPCSAPAETNQTDNCEHGKEDHEADIDDPENFIPFGRLLAFLLDLLSLHDLEAIIDEWSV